MAQVCIGVHVHMQPEQLRATLNHIHLHTAHSVELLILPDGPDEPTKTMLASLKDLRQLGTNEPRGAPACFNRLIAASDADVLVLLESGALVGPGWLDYLLAALETDWRNGLAGPSTNRSWNEQGVFRRAGCSLAAIASAAKEARDRFGATTHTLEPLYSLADFCYVVRRSVVQEIGAADEGYELGPCWEMDYNIRAARAGWRGVWACGAYVYRLPFTVRRWREESLRFETNRQRYQDHFCALRLRGARTDYEPHCRGDACEHFAPSDHIHLHLPLPAATPQPACMQQADRPSTVADASQTARRAVPFLCPPSPARPLVSCVMPTRNRAAFALQSIRYFQQQDYPERELIIVDDGSDELAARLPDDPRVRYLRAPNGMSIGAKRNLACEAAHGEIVAQWDDDDWYASHRLSAQIAPLLADEAAISGLMAGVFFDLPRWEFWRCTPDLRRRLFVADVHGGTLVYRRDVWKRLARYPDQSVAEDALFLRQAIAGGARLCRLPSAGLFIYLRHAVNSWAFTCGQFLDPAGWRRLAEPPLPLGDRTFYAGQSLAALAPPVAAPLVSCIMPTANRRSFVPQAIAYFLRQDYEPKELIVVDDGDTPVGDQLPDDSRIRYIRLDQRTTVGAKRNLACSQAHGALIAHWDDDDWHAPHRLRYQVQALAALDVDICGIAAPLFYEIGAGRAWRYVYPNGWRPWLSGNSLCYTRAFWEANRFPPIDVGEDAHFVWSAHPERLLALADPMFHVGIIHPHNVSPKQTGGVCWRPIPSDEIRMLLGEDWGFYQVDR